MNAAMGQWEIGFQKVLGQEIRGSTVGIIGFGGIGQTVVKKLAGFEIDRFLYTGHREKPEGKALGAAFVTQEQLLAQSDFVLLAVPLTSETNHMVNKELLGKMKKNAILINVGRGDLVDQDALYDALKNNVIYAAGLDVTTPEPLPKDHKLLTLPNLWSIISGTVRYSLQEAYDFSAITVSLKGRGELYFEDLVAKRRDRNYEQRTKTLMQLSSLFPKKKSIVNLKATIANSVVRPGELVQEEVPSKVEGTGFEYETIPAGDTVNFRAIIEIPQTCASIDHSAMIARKYAVKTVAVKKISL
ncbi:hypothetical protein MSG28_013379 [Choristoneura fumiferana]|uniref:Uncharacterized protein n=1 Tax=Choristoneura fumiferana TaxID=7141 RepID=A0ACC0KTS8_CHOFU|nr:hypothetical protein MSG28_013379 [Choristoneura fumiferana]